MKKYALALGLMTAACFYSAKTMALQTMFYSTRENISPAIMQHHEKINVIITQAYYTDADNKIAGRINTSMLNAAKKYQVQVIAQVTNHLFDLPLVHAFLTNEALQKAAITDLVQKCQQDDLAGIQIDFEHMRIDDQNRFNQFIQKLSAALHANQRILSVAVVPPMTAPKGNSYLEARNKNWSGVYDLATLAKFADFIDLMTYDQHVDLSTPGPIAGYAWDQFVITEALKTVPKEKLLFGIPTYSGYWKMKTTDCGQDGKILVSGGEQIGYDSVLKLKATYHPTVRWDERDKIHYAFFAPDFIYRYLFIEDADSLNAKMKLAEQFGLYGVAIFRLGIEDPNIWNVLPTTNAQPAS